MNIYIDKWIYFVYTNVIRIPIVYLYMNNNKNNNRKYREKHIEDYDRNKSRNKSRYL